jgi:hypothetical protein
MITDVSPQFDQIIAKFSSDFADCLDWIRDETEGESLYAIGLGIANSGGHVIVYANTEEGLTRVAIDYSARDDGAVEKHRDDLRWSAGDWAYEVPTDILRTTNEVLGDLDEVFYSEFGDTDTDRSHICFAALVAGVARVIATGRLASFDPKPFVGVWTVNAGYEEAGWHTLVNDPDVSDEYTRYCEG